MPLETPIVEAPDEVRRILAPLRHGFSVALYAPGNGFAIGAIIRTAHNFLAREIIVIGSDAFYEKAAMGMDKYENVVPCLDGEAFSAHVGTRPVWGLEKDCATASLDAIATVPDDVVFLFGSERAGIPAAALERCARVVGIPVFGVNHSLPLAIAAGIVMHDYTRRYYARGRVR